MATSWSFVMEGFMQLAQLMLTRNLLMLPEALRVRTAGELFECYKLELPSEEIQERLVGLTTLKMNINGRQIGEVLSDIAVNYSKLTPEQQNETVFNGDVAKIRTGNKAPLKFDTAASSKNGLT